MNDMSNQTRSVVVERAIPHPPEKIWRALTQSHLIAEWLMSNDFKAEGGHAFCGLPLNMWPSRLITGLVVVETDRPQGHDPIQHNHCREAIGMSWLPIGSGRCWLEIAPACRCRSSAEAIPAEVRSALRPELHEALRQSVPAVRRSGKRSRDSELECGEKRPLTVC